MKKTRLLFVALALSAQTAHAQNCLGHRSLANAPVNGSLNYRFMEKARGPEVRMLFGKPVLFGGFDIGLLSLGAGNRSFDIGAQVGTSWRVGNALILCPIASINYQPSALGTTSYPRTTEISFGGAAGTEKSVSGRVTMIPYLGVEYLRARFQDVFDPRTESTSQLTHSGAQVFGGVGVQFTRRFLARAAFRYRNDFGSRSNTFILGVTVAPTRKIRSK